MNIEAAILIYILLSKITPSLQYKALLLKGSVTRFFFLGNDKLFLSFLFRVETEKLLELYL